jgi:hypothetical protein
MNTAKANASQRIEDRFLLNFQNSQPIKPRINALTGVLDELAKMMSRQKPVPIPHKTIRLRSMRARPTKYGTSIAKKTPAMMGCANAP